MKNGILFRKLQIGGGAIILSLFFSSVMFSQNCNWQDATIGSAAIGTATYPICDPVTATITATAYTSSTTADEQNFVYRELCGDGELVTHLTGLIPASGYYGIEFRENLAAGAMKFGLKKHGTGFTLTKMSRSATNAAASNLPVNDFNRTWFKIVRSGDVFTSYTSSDGSNWFQIQTTTIVMPTCIVGGMLVHGFNAIIPVSGSFDDIAFSGEGAITNEALYCGWKIRSTPVDSTLAQFSDRFGNLYTRTEVSIPQSTSSSFIQGNGLNFSFDGCDCLTEFGINTGYFDLWFEDCLFTQTGFNDPVFGSERRRVACQVYSEIATLLPMVAIEDCDFNPNRSVNIRISPSENIMGLDPFPPNTISEASSYYTSFKEQLDGFPWIIINTGEELQDWTTLYHGEVRINFQDPNVIWSTDLDDPPPSDEYDLYTVMWHETIHLLGFTSIATMSDKRYSRYDKFLFLDYANGTTLPLIEINGFNWIYSAGVNTNTDFFSGCQNPNIIGPDFNFTSNTGGTYPVLADDATNFLEENSHSHLNIDCDGNTTSPFLMHVDFEPGERRTITVDELDILCTLGYAVNAAPNSCNCTVAGAEDIGANWAPDICDEVYQVTLCETLTIETSFLLHNDNNATDIAFLDVRNPIYGDVVDNQDGSYTFTPAILGLAVLAYIPTGCEGEEGNFTNIYIQVVASPECPLSYACEEYALCQDLPQYPACTLYNDCEELSPCNIICNSGFCGTIYRNSTSISYNSAVLNFPYIFALSNNSFVPNWIRTHGTPDIAPTGGGFGGGLFARIACQSIEEITPGVELEGGLTEGFMTTVNFEEGNYLLAFDQALLTSNTNNTNPSLMVDLIEASSLTIPENIEVFATYEVTAPRENLISNENAILDGTWSGDYQREGACFHIEEESLLDALWFYLPQNGSNGFAYLDNVELIQDKFALGDDPDPIPCGDSQDIGGDFCMLSNVGVDYTWFEITPSGQTPILSYTVLDGNIISTIDNPNNLPFDADTRVLSVSPTMTTTYRLVRNVNVDNDGGLLDLFAENCALVADQITITVIGTIPNPDFTIDETDCMFTFSPHPLFTGPEYTHIWIFGTLGTSSATFPPAMSFPEGTYDIIHIITGTCGEFSQTQTITVTVPDAAFTYMADCLDVHFMATDFDVESYAWDFGDGATGLGENPMHSYTFEGFYTVTLTVVDDCGLTANFSLLVEVKDCSEGCNCDVGINIDGGTEGVLLSTLIADGTVPPTQITNTCISITGRLIVDVDYTITGGQIRMHPGAGIDVLNITSSIQLTLTDITEDRGIYGACGQMWRGIRIFGNTTVVMSGCLIQDAYHALEPRNKSSLEVFNTVFNNNYIGLFNDKFAQFVLGHFYGNEIHGTGSLLAAYNNQPETPGNWPYAGIHIIKIPTVGSFGAFPLSIGVTGQADNLFNQVRNGILLEGNIDATIVQSRFRNIENGTEPPASYPLRGFGIHFAGSNAAALTQFGAVNIFASANFFECRTGIWTSHVDVDIKSNKMQKVNFGIHVEQTTMGNIDVANNLISTRNYGIVLRENDDALDLSVHDNYISVGESGTLVKGLGISINEATMRPSGVSAVIRDNRILLFGGGGTGSNGFVSCKGIAINSVNELKVSNNVIHCLATGNNGGNVGIEYKNGHHNQINENQIFGAGTATISLGGKTGLKITDCTDTEYNCNYFERLYTGVVFIEGNEATGAIGTYLDTELRTSTFQPPFYNALHYEKNIMINQQQWNGNKWRGTAADYGTAVGGVAALNEIMTDEQDVVAAQQYLIQQYDENYWPPSIDLPYYTGAGQPWIVSNIAGTADICSQSWYNLIPEIKATDKLVAEGSVPTTSTEALEWETQKSLFAKLKNGNYDLTDYPMVEIFFTTANNAVIGEYTFVENEQKMIYAEAKEAQNQIAALRLEQEGIRGQLIIKDSLYVTNPSQTLLTEREALLLLLQDKNDAIQVLIDQVMAARVLVADETLLTNSNLVTATTAQQNEQTFNAIYLNTLSRNNTDFTTTQIDDILAIARQCPSSGGRVVYKARSLYTLIDDEVVFEGNCSASQALQSGEEDTVIAVDNNKDGASVDKSIGEVKIYPNPAHTILIINYGELKEGHIVVFSALGSVVHESFLTAGTTQIQLNTSSWSEGLYFVKTYTGKTELSTDKIIIIH